MHQMGQDGLRLLEALEAEQIPAQLRELAEVAGLRMTWSQQFVWQEGQFCLRNKDDLPPAHQTIRSPYDHDAHYGVKRDQSWFGYKVHFTETCDEDFPHLITAVKTTNAADDDATHTAAIQQQLAERDLLPTLHLVDAGYVDAPLILASQRAYEVNLLGPVSLSRSWQAKAGQGYDLASFQIDWDKQRATCPQGKHSVTWSERARLDRGGRKPDRYPL